MASHEFLRHQEPAHPAQEHQIIPEQARGLQIILRQLAQEIQTVRARPTQTLIQRQAPEQSIQMEGGQKPNQIILLSEQEQGLRIDLH